MATSARPISATSIGPIGRTPVTITAHESGDSVMLRFHNGGPAIPPDVLPFVFEPLARGRRESAGHSIGLGLFIAPPIASAHGGNVQVSSSADTGTTFRHAAQSVVAGPASRIVA